MVNVNSTARLSGGREVKVYSFIVKDYLNFFKFRSLDCTLKKLRPNFFKFRSLDYTLKS